MFGRIQTHSLQEIRVAPKLGKTRSLRESSESLNLHAFFLPAVCLDHTEVTPQPPLPRGAHSQRSRY